MQKLSSVSTRVSERTKSAWFALRSLCEEIIQWRRPVVSSYYLLITNAAFWGCAFYLEQSQQLLFLVSLASVIFVTSILSTAVIATTEIVPNTQRSYKKWFGEQENGELVQRGSFVSTLLKPVGVIAFVLESFFLPMFSFTFSLIFQRPASLAVMTGSTLAAHYLQLKEQERACWTAYLTVLLTIVIPPWRYNGVTDQIIAFLSSTYQKTRDWFVLNVFSPIFRFLRSVFYVVRYILCGHWIPPLVTKVTDICRRIWASIRRYFLDPIGCALAYLKRVVIYWVCGHWIPPLVEYLREKKRQLFEWIDRRIVQPIVAAYNRIRRFCIYWFGGYWIAPFRQYCADKRDELILAFHQYVINPIIDFFSDFKNNMKYILFGHWIPPFIAWSRRRIIDPIIEAIIRIYNVADYVFCGRWIPGLIAYLRGKALEAKAYTEDCLQRFRAYLILRAIQTRDYIIRRAIEARDFIIRSAIRTRDYCRDLANRTVVYIRTNLIIPFIEWIKESRIRLRFWFIHSVLIPAWEGTKEQWRRFKYYVKHHVLYPALRRTAYLIISGIVYAWKNGVMPVLVVIGEYGARGKEYAWINWGEPATDWLARNLPEKSPFVDDSDTELKDFLPSEDEDEATMDENVDDEEISDHLPHEELPNIPAGPSNVIRLKLPAQVHNFVSHHLAGSSSEEEDEFSIGLNFPAVENADSDEEEEKMMVPRRLSSASSSSAQRRRKPRKLSGTSVASSPAKVLSEQKEPTSTTTTPQASQRHTFDLDPDFEMVDHNEVDD